MLPVIRNCAKVKTTWHVRQAVEATALSRLHSRVQIPYVLPFRKWGSRKRAFFMGWHIQNMGIIHTKTTVTDYEM